MAVFGGAVVASAVLYARTGSGLEAEGAAWVSVEAEDLRSCAPWRTFRWYRGQRHYSGTYWSATDGDHVIYESRLELARLIDADFDPGVTAIRAQPFLVEARVDGQVRRHVPDFLLLGGVVPVVVDVKPQHRLDDPKVTFVAGWTRELVQARGWVYEVWCEPPVVRAANLRFLAGYRRRWLFDPALLAAVRRDVLDGVTLGEAVASVVGWPAPLVRAAMLHLLWAGDLVTDLDAVLSAGHRLERAG